MKAGGRGSSLLPRAEGWTGSFAVSKTEIRDQLNGTLNMKKFLGVGWLVCLFVCLAHSINYAPDH